MTSKENVSYNVEDILSLIYILTGTKEEDLYEMLEDENHLIPKEYVEMVEADLKEYFKDTSRDLGFCRLYWQKKREFFAELGYDWKSPMEKFPDVHFD